MQLKHNLDTKPSPKLVILRIKKWCISQIKGKTSTKSMKTSIKSMKFDLTIQMNTIWDLTISTLQVPKWVCIV